MPQGFGPPASTGCGVDIDPDGLILTDRHVVGDAREVSVILDDGTILPGAVPGVDNMTDLALIDVSASDLPAVPLGDSVFLAMGQLAIAIGNPLGRFPNSASVGIVSGLDRSINVRGWTLSTSRLRHFVQTDAAVNPGTLGGALVDGDGKLIGVTTVHAGMSDGIGFAIPIDFAKPIIMQVLCGHEIARPHVGVWYREVDQQLSTAEGLPVASGAWITSSGDPGVRLVAPGSPAAQAGIRNGDIITAADGVEVDQEHPLDLQFLRFKPGDVVTLTVNRDREALELPATPRTRPEIVG